MNTSIPDNQLSSRSSRGNDDPLFSGRRHYPELDGLRALAIIAVIGLHTGAYLTPDELAAVGPVGRAIHQLFTHGAWGVDLFFVLSGYLITGILLNSRGQKHYFRNFYARRTLRIFPLYYGTLLAVLVVLPLVLGRVPAMISEAYHQQAWLWTYTANIEGAMRGGGPLGNFLHFWTLAIEEQFYLVWPLVIFLTPPRWLLRTTIVGILAVNLARLLFIAMQYSPSRGWDGFAVYNWLSSFTLFRADSLLIGGVLAVLHTDGALKAWRRVFTGGFILVSGAILAVLFVLPHNIHGLPLAVVGHVFLAPLLFGCAVGYVLICRNNSGLIRILSLRPLRAVGKYSYAMYVFHYIYLPLQEHWAPYSLFKSLLHSALFALVIYYSFAVVVAFIVAFISYHLYEKHFLKLKKYFPEKVVAPAASVVLQSSVIES
jgi:peptidoglycan/LPS O-acetylase OafA/YrhL